MLKSATKVVLVAVMTTLISATSVAAMADTPMNQTHPRRDQVNDRLQNQNQRIHQEVKQGDMSKRKAERLHRADRRIHREEHRMASKNGGRIDQQQQNRLNHQENKVSQKIGQ